jgi:hypothetical protein
MSRDCDCDHRPTDLLLVSCRSVRNRSFVLGFVTTIIHPEPQRRHSDTDSDTSISSWVMERAASQYVPNPSFWQNKRSYLPVGCRLVVLLTELRPAKAFRNYGFVSLRLRLVGSFWPRRDCTVESLSLPWNRRTGFDKRSGVCSHRFAVPHNLRPSPLVPDISFCVNNWLIPQNKRSISGSG